MRFVVTCFWMDTERALQQVIHPFTDIHIEPWVTILQHDFFLKVLTPLGGALRGKKKTYIIHYACVFIISPNAVVFKEKNKQLKVTQRPYVIRVELRTCFLMAWSLINFQRVSGFFSFWKSCCNSFLTCKHRVKV